MIQSFFTKEQKWLDKWDNYLHLSNRGLYNQYSDWIKSYNVYGFDYDFYLITEDETIIGGCGIVIAKFSFFKFMIVPCGPVLNKEHENQLDNLLFTLNNYAKKIKCCYFQINVPIEKEKKLDSNYAFQNISSTSFYHTGKIGTKFKYVIPLFGMRLINLKSNNFKVVLQNYSSNHKRNVKKIANYDFEFQFITSENEVEKAYECFVLNAKLKGYPIREYQSIKETLYNYIKKDFAKIGVCKYQNQIVGAIYVMKCANKLIYINGGVLEEFQNLPISVFMHNEVIKHSIEEKYKYYDISVGGSSGVVRFKEGFGSELIEYENSRYWILKPFLFSIYNFAEKKLRNNKQLISKALFILKKRLK